ncbi:YkvA family protein [Desulfobulbus oligotrophicus]|uniref:DUF1232 domain-containing protein n=1 Tax=Desulfobulbus oligotrophicus TaxID=1909699 RepID=A0A7T5VCK2_9BACT|nr:DUF1232 domain-containing protein [Desulfobulbus oligotrophicus]QQG65384.1 DUF1232 domain-containing protein [Desulfobulbus oligotrophicus]
MHLWSVLTRLGHMLLHTKEVFFSPRAPVWVKGVLALGLLYILSPYDIIPEWIPVVGVMDDLALAALLVTWAARFDVSG